MLDRKYILEHVEQIKKNCADRGLQVDVDHIVELDGQRREKLQLVEDLWDDLASTPEDVPVHAWQEEELERRKANLMKYPAPALTWDQVKERARRLHDR